MTEGKALPLLLFFTIPLFFGNIFQQLYAMVDTIVVGRFVGVEALAAVGSVGGFSFMVIGFASGLAQGFAVLISQRFGAKDEEGIKKAYTQGVISCFAVTIVVSAAFYVLSMPLLHLINTPDNIIEMANDYISIIYAFLIANVFFNYFSSILRALGDSKSPVIFLLIASVLNIVLDLFLIIVIPLGVKGVAIATVVSQAVSAFIAYFYIQHKFKVFKTVRADWTIDWALIRKLLSIGLPSALQFSVCAIGTIIVQAVLNPFGSDCIASYAVGIKIENVLTQFFPAIGMAISTYAGQNLGAGQFDRIRVGFRKAVLLSNIYAIIATVLTIFLSRPLSLLFIEGNEGNQEVIRMAVQYSVLVSLFYIPLGLIFVYRTGCQGLGSGTIPLLSSIIELVARIIAAFALPGLLGYFGICLASPVAWIGAGFLLPFIYHNYFSKLIKSYNKPGLATYIH